MSNENTARRGLYLPIELDQWLIDQADLSGIKVNSLIISALIEFKESKTKSVKKQDDDFDRRVNALIERYIEKYESDQL